MAFGYLFNSTIRKISSINIILGYLLLKVIKKRLDKKKALFDYFNRF